MKTIEIHFTTEICHSCQQTCRCFRRTIPYHVFIYWCNQITIISNTHVRHTPQRQCDARNYPSESDSIIT